MYHGSNPVSRKSTGFCYFLNPIHQKRQEEGGMKKNMTHSMLYIFCSFVSVSLCILLGCGGGGGDDGDGVSSSVCASGYYYCEDNKCCKTGDGCCTYGGLFYACCPPGSPLFCPSSNKCYSVAGSSPCGISGEIVCGGPADKLSERTFDGWISHDSVPPSVCVQIN